MKKYLFPLIALLTTACNSGEETTTVVVDEPVAEILEYTPAPGQFINEEAASGGDFRNVDTPAKACEYVVRRFAQNNWVSLGGFGGYVVGKFAQPLRTSGDYDLYVKGNAIGTSSEPGVVWVMQDADGDGIANDTWYELKGSEYGNPATKRNYTITYTRPAGDNQPVAWRDTEGGSGTIDRMDEHTQASYFPIWITGSEASYTGTRLPDNVSQVDNLWTAKPFAWGYADNYSSIDGRGTTNRFRISDAVDSNGNPANLVQIDFIKVQCGVNSKAPQIGEISTEVCGMGCYRTITKRL